MQFVKAAILLTVYSLLAACQQPVIREAVPLRPDLDHPDRLVCEGVPQERPAIPPAYVIDWSMVGTVEQARAEHENFVRSIIGRNEIVSGYLVLLEGRLFVCSNNAEFWRDYRRDLDG